MNHPVPDEIGPDIVGPSTGDNEAGTDPAVPVDRDRRRLAALAGLATLVAVTVPIALILVSRTSSASFADSEVLSANRLGAATLDIEVEASPGGSEVSEGESTSTQIREALFSATNLAPGDRVTGQLEMTNAGDVPLRYGLLATGDGGVLQRWLRFEVWAAGGTCAPGQPGLRIIEDVALGAEPVPLVELRRPDEANVLGPGDTFVWCIGATLALETPNEAQGQRLDVTLIVPAEQVVEEGP